MNRPLGFADATHEHDFSFVEMGGCAFRYCSCGLTHVLWQFTDGVFRLVEVDVSQDWEEVREDERCRSSSRLEREASEGSGG